MKMLHRIKSIAIRLWKDERGASLLEYSVLIGIILAITIVAVTFVGNWAGGQWADLQTKLTGKGAPPVGP
jgi:Flp pilus assembly pilin Flp